MSIHFNKILNLYKIYLLHRVKSIAKKYTNIRVRIEDNILVAENGYENLSIKAPKKIDEIEKFMKKKNYLNNK